MVLEDWAADVEKAVNNMEDMSKESGLKKERCIYRVPDYIRELDYKACEPQVVSLGPYQYHDERHLKPMEEHKNRALLHFLKRSKKPLHRYLDALTQKVEDLKDAYDQPLPEAWILDNHERFLMMMILDGCFILEILHTAGHYNFNVSIFNEDGYLNELPLIRRDMLLLENQVPLRLLEILVAVDGEDMGADERGGSYNVTYLPPLSRIPGSAPADEHVVINSIRRFFGLARRSKSMDKQGGLHILDVYRRGLLVEPEPLNGRLSFFQYFDLYDSMLMQRSLRLTPEFHDIDIPSATELHEAGIRLKTSKTTNLNDITIKGSTLRFPPIMVKDDTKSFFLNLMAFERVHAGAGREVTSYVYFMGCLIKSDGDARLLRSLGFVPSALGSDEDVAQLFRLISKKAMLHQRELVEVFQSVNEKLRNRVRKRLSAWRMDLLQNYLKSPWGVVSVIGAIILFTLTAIQTVYSVLSYIHRKDK